MVKWIKKTGTAAVASALILTSVPSVWAAEAAVSKVPTAVSPGMEQSELKQDDVKITKEQALDIVQKLIPIPKGFTLQAANLNTYSANGVGKPQPSWNLNFSKKLKEQYQGNINVTIQAMTGKLMGYYYYNGDPEFKPSYPPKVNYEGAKKIAAEWLNKMNADESGSVRYNDRDEKSFRTPLQGNYQYNIRYDRIVDGVPFPQDGITISVNGEGEVAAYNYSWTDGIVFEEAAAPISGEKAAQVFRDQADMYLTYQVPYETRGERKPYIAYAMNPFLLDAVKGEPWYPAGSISTKRSGLKPIVDKPLAEEPKENLNLTKEQAAEKISSTFQLADGAKLEDASYQEYTNDQTGKTETSWNLRWSLSGNTDSGGKDFNDAWATINAKTGQITNFNRNMPYYGGQNAPFNPKVSVDEAEAKAIDFVKKNLPAYAHQLILEDTGMRGLPEESLKNIRTWEIRFSRTIDGVLVNGENVNLSIDRETGKIINYYFNFSGIAYPAQKPEVINAEKAKESLFSQYDLELNYASGEGIYGSYWYGGMGMDKYRAMGPAIPQGKGQSDKIKAKLVYALVPKYTHDPFFLDAQTGQWRSAINGEPITLEKIVATDIEGHWAQNELQLMLDYQALDVKDGKANPEQSITRGEMVKMLVIAMNGGNQGIYYSAARPASFKDVANGSAYFAYVENAVDRGLLDPGTEFNPSTIMTREDMAQLIVRALGYKNLAKHDKVFNRNFADAPELKQIGDAAIVVGLGIMTTSEDGRFQPDVEVTRAQAATGFFRYLQVRAGLQQQPRYY